MGKHTKKELEEMCHTLTAVNDSLVRQLDAAKPILEDLLAGQTGAPSAWLAKLATMKDVLHAVALKAGCSCPTLAIHFENGRVQRVHDRLCPVGETLLVLVPEYAEQQSGLALERYLSDEEIKATANRLRGHFYF